ncbi:hypothetical protein GW17_00050144 [Ensete ventricosum]|nr:hypothetical protein GW17_00050144 [Ensete ventricosum]RZS10223.1 hypothetical protein BHM03_00041400 [Ensete ventricosum]
MLPLRFPNSCIRAKVFMRKVGFKLRVMRLNHVESFYTFLLHFYGKRSEERAQLAMARPSTGVAGYGLATWLPLVGAPAGATPMEGAARVRGTDHKGNSSRSLAWRLPAGEGSRRLCRGSDDDIVRVREES